VVECPRQARRNMAGVSPRTYAGAAHALLDVTSLQQQGVECSVVDFSVDGSVLRIETKALAAEVHTEGYVSGLAAGSLLDKKTGARDLGFGLNIVDFLVEPGEDTPAQPPELRYEWGDPRHHHGDIPKRYVELPQICTKAGKLPYAAVRGDGWVAVHQWFRYREATYGRRPGSLWEQTLLFIEGTRYFLASDRITSVNAAESLLLRLDMPGHLKHRHGDTFSQVYLSYHGFIPSTAFSEDFGPSQRFMYRRDDHNLPSRFIRAYRVRQGDTDGPWLAGMTLDAAAVYEAWCHQRGYVCMIQEIGGWPVREGESFGTCNLIGFFDSVDEMNAVYDRYRGAAEIRFVPRFEVAERIDLVGAEGRTMALSCT